MKKNLLTSLGLVCAAIAFAGCSFTVPKKVYLKTNAEYNFTVANYSDSFGEYLDAKSIQEKLPADSKMQVMDYNPAGNCKEQRFLAKIELMSIPVDMTEYIKDLTVDGLSIEQKIAIPSVSISEEKNLALSALSEEINGAIEFAGPFLGTNKIEVSGTGDEVGTFSSAVYRNGSLDIYVDNAEAGAYVIVENDQKEKLTGYFTELASPVTKSIFGTSYSAEMKYKASIDLAGQPISMNAIKMEFSGTDISYGKFFVGEIPESAKIEKIYGVNLVTTFDSLSAQSFTIDSSDFDSLEIGEAKLKVNLELPEAWKNADLDLTYSVKLGDDVWIAEGKGGVEEVIKNKVLKNGTLSITPAIKLTVTNGEVTLYDDLKIGVACSVNKINSITLDKTALGLDSALSIDPVALPEDVTKIVKGIWFGQSELKVTSSTDLPEGNDIEVGINSSFLKFNNQKFTIANGEHTATLTASESSDYTLTAGASVDITPTVKLPNENGTKFTLKNIEPGKEYSLAMSAVPEVKWEKLKVDVTSLDTGIKSDPEGLDTGLNLGEVLKDTNENLGNMLKDLKLAELPLYIYCQTGTDAFSGIKIKGDLSLTNGINTVKVLDNQNLEFVDEMPNFAGDENGVVTDVISSKSYSATADIANLISFDVLDPAGSLKVFYDLGVTGADGSDIVIEHDKLDKVSNFEVSAVVDLPVKFKLTGDGAKIDLTEFTKKTEDPENPSDPSDIWKDDILGRKEPYSFKDIDKYITAVKKATVKATSEFPLEYEDGISFDITIKLNPDSSESPKVLHMDKVEYSLTNEEIRYILENPFNPEIFLELPAGTLRINRGLDYKTKLDLQIITDGKIPLFEEN